MWDRIELKEKGKLAYRNNVWNCIVVALILSLIGVGSSSGITFNINGEEVALSNLFSLQLFKTVASIAGIVILALKIFVLNPIEIGGSRFFIENANDVPTPGKIFFVFENKHYGSAVKTMFLRDLYVFLWSLLFVIPGIIKSYEYRMVPYLMAEAPDLDAQEAFRISRELMYGEKLNAFVLDLSFIGWYILGAFTCGILNIVFTTPYVHATNAELFLLFKKRYFGENV